MCQCQYTKVLITLHFFASKRKMFKKQARKTKLQGIKKVIQKNLYLVQKLCATYKISITKKDQYLRIMVFYNDSAFYASNKSLFNRQYTWNKLYYQYSKFSIHFHTDHYHLLTIKNRGAPNSDFLHTRFSTYADHIKFFCKIFFT